MNVVILVNTETVRIRRNPLCHETDYTRFFFIQVKLSLTVFLHFLVSWIRGHSWPHTNRIQLVRSLALTFYLKIIKSSTSWHMDVDYDLRVVTLSKLITKRMFSKSVHQKFLLGLYLPKKQKTKLTFYVITWVLSCLAYNIGEGRKDGADAVLLRTWLYDWDN